MAEKTKQRKMWVHYGLEAVEARVYWKGRGLAVTRVGTDELAITHIMTGNRIMAKFISGKTLPVVKRVARVLDSAYPWPRLSFHDIVKRRDALGRKADAVLKKAGVLP